MFTKTELDKIKKISEDFFQKMSFKVEVKVEFSQDATVSILAKTEEPQILIGEGGKTLIEIQHLLKRILQKQIQKTFYVDLDINDYKKKKIEYLKDIARSAADEVVLSKKEKILPPMPAYERRIIHLELAARGNVTTESIGQGAERRVVVKPYP